MGSNGTARDHRARQGLRARTALAVLALGLALVSAACSDDGESSESADSASGDLVTAEISQGPNSTLSAELTLEIDPDATVEVDVSGPGDSVAVGEIPEGSETVTVPVVGMRAEETYEVAVNASSGSDSETLELEFTTGAIPDDFPPLEVAVSDPEQMADGVTLFNAMYWGPAAADADETGSAESASGDEGDSAEGDTSDPGGIAIAIDSEGEVIWYYRTDVVLTDLSMTQDGNILASVDDVIIREIDVLGNTVKEFGTRVASEYVPTNLNGHTFMGEDTVPIEIDSAHHELQELPSGNYLTLSTEKIDFDPADVAGLCDGRTTQDGEVVSDPKGIVGDVVVELTPEGEVVQEWAISDVYDPLERPGTDMCALPVAIAPPNWFYQYDEEVRDWTHGNAAIVDEDNNTLIVSLRHLDAVIGLRYHETSEAEPAGELLWELSETGTLTMQDGGQFAYHGHAVELQDDGTLLYYDNGNGRPGSVQVGGDEPPYSRAVQYRVNAEEGTVEQVWEHRDTAPDGSPQFTGFLSDADRVSNGNVLITHGGAADPDTELNYSRFVEVIPSGEGPDNEIVFDVIMGDRKTIGWTAYRAERLDSLIP